MELPQATQHTDSERNGAVDDLDWDRATAPPPARPARPSTFGGLPVWLVLVLALVPLVVGIASFVVAQARTPSYSSTSLVRITVLAPTGPSDTTVAAESAYAAQYALLATSTPVIDGAARATGIAPSVLGGAVTSGTDSGRNLVTVAATAGSPADSARRADAVAQELVRAAARSARDQRARYLAQTARGRRSLDESIASYRDLVANGGAELRSSRSQVLGTLIAEKQRQIASGTGVAVASVPAVDVWARASAGSVTGLDSGLYGLIGFAVALVVCGYVGYAVRQRGRST